MAAVGGPAVVAAHDPLCHGALLLGHAHPAAIQAVQSVVENGLHFGNDHPRMLEWAGLIRDLIPCAERVRFDNSGTEGTMLALRLARAFTGRTKLTRMPVPPVSGSTPTRLVSELSEAPLPKARRMPLARLPKPWTR